MPFLVSALGLFYVVAGVMVLRQARLEWLVDRTVGGLTQVSAADRNRLYFMAVSASLYAVAGAALLLRSSVAVWLLGAGLMLQAAYYGILWRVVTNEERANDDRWAKAWTAAMLSAAAFAFAAYALRRGILT